MLDPSPSDICRLISTTRCVLSNEKHTQADLARALDAAGIAYQREARLLPLMAPAPAVLVTVDIPDFLIGGIVVEVKLKGARKMDVFRQLCRYATHDQVKAIILATNMSMGLPAEIEGKPTYYVSLARAWL